MSSESSSNTTKKTKDATKGAIDKGEEIIDQGQGYAEKASSKAKNVLTSVGESSKEGISHVGQTLEEFSHDQEAQNRVAETAGTFLGTMRSKGGGIGQETEAFGRGVQMVGSTIEKVPEEAKEAIIRGGKKLADATDRIWTKIFRLVEKGLDALDERLFEIEDVEEGSRRGELQGSPGDVQREGREAVYGHEVPLLGRMHRSMAAGDKEREKRGSTVKLVTKVLGGVVLLLLLTLLLFFLGFFLLPVLLIAMIVLLFTFQCWAWCGLG